MSNLTLPPVGEWQEQGVAPTGHPIKAMIVPETGQDYHDRPELSHSEFKLYIDEPERFDRVVLRQIEKLQFSAASIKSMDFGDKAEYVLFHNRFPGEPKLIPRDVLSRRKRAAKWYDENNLEYDADDDDHHIFAKSGKAWKAFVGSDENKGKWLIHPSEWVTEIDPLSRVREQVRSHKEAKSLVYGPRETHLAIVFVCPWTGIMCRCQLDILSLWLRRIVDIKTTYAITPKGFATQCFNMGYHIQDVWYSYAVYSLLGIYLPFQFVAIKNKSPYNVEVFELTDKFKDIGRTEWRENMLAIQRSVEEGRFTTMTHGRVAQLPPPPWAKARTQFNKGYLTA